LKEFDIQEYFFVENRVFLKLPSVDQHT